MSAATKLVIGGIVIAAAGGGGYYYADMKANEVANQAMQTFKADVESTIPGSSVSFGAVTAKAFEQKATVAEFALRVGNDAKLSADSVNLMIKDGALHSSEFFDLSLAASLSKRESIKADAERLLLVGLDVAQIREIIDNLVENPNSAPNQIDQLTFDEVALNGLTFSGFYREKKVVELKPSNIQLTDVKNSTFNTLKIDGEFVAIEENESYSLGSFEVDSFDASKIILAAMRNDEALLLEGLSEGFGINAVRLSEFKFDDGKIKGSINSADISVSADKLASFNISGINFNNLDENITGGFDSAFVKTLDLKMLSPEILTPQGQAIAASSYAGITGFGIKGGFAQSNDIDAKRMSVGEISLDGIETKENFVTKAALKIDKFALPMGFLKEADRRFARTVQEITGADEMTMSFGISSDYDTATGSYGANLNFDVEKFAGIELQTQLAGLPFSTMKQMAGEADFERQLQHLQGLMQTLAVSGVEITYTDGMLADKVLEEAPPKEQLVAMMSQNLGMVLAAYPAERDQIIQAVSNFLDGRNTLSVKISTKTPILVEQLEKDFMSGTLNQNLALAANGS